MLKDLETKLDTILETAKTNGGLSVPDVKQAIIEDFLAVKLVLDGFCPKCAGTGLHILYKQPPVPCESCKGTGRRYVKLSLKEILADYEGWKVETR